MVRGFAQFDLEKPAAAHLALPADRRKLPVIMLPCSHTWLVACCGSWRRTLLALLVTPQGISLLLLCMSVLLWHVRF